MKRLHFCQVDAAFAAMKATCVRSIISFGANYTTAQKNGQKTDLFSERIDRIADVPKKDAALRRSVPFERLIGQPRELIRISQAHGK
ncbi:hypothetical protein [Rhizobium sp. SJZ105]|uniref:hypothetical protein n=1 Tax=Rhizobium sp. SJZ105 TaxID=2572678 RepID=UPI002AA5831A|nr:hypothetical protein [Rhizobium sp. SJZ105]